MATKRLLFAWLTVWFVVLAGDVNAQSVGTDFRNLDERARLLKAEALKLNRDLFILEDELSYPASTHLAVFLSVDTSSPFPLDSVELRIDDKVVTNHRYAQRELSALFRGGVHRLYTGNLDMGQHELTAFVTGGSRKAQRYRKSASLIFHKMTDPKLIELKIVKPKGKQQPELKLPGSDRYRESGEIKEPYFGEVLFDVYQGKYSSATTRLMAAQETQKIGFHADEAELLLGDLYLSYGLHRRAGRIFARKIDQGVPPDVTARARFYLAKNWYQRGYLRRAQDALLRSRDALSMELQDERRVLLALVLMKQNRYREAVAILRQFRGKSEWAAYARYNIGVGLLQVGRRKQGVAVLEKTARMRAKKDEMKVLRDKANLALGFTFLSVEKPSRAKSYFGEVSLNGPFSNKALLGIGWALSAKGKHKKSLVPWMELQNRNDIDIAVQESLLAVPYALSELGAYKQSLRQYENAIAVYNAEIERLGQTVESLREGKLLPAVVSLEPSSENGSVGREKKLPDTPENRYLVHLFASHDFHEALKNYRDLHVLSQNLDCLSSTMDVYNTVLEMRRDHQEQRPPTVEGDRVLDLTTSTQKREHYAEQSGSENHKDAVVLAAAQGHELPNLSDGVGQEIANTSDLDVSNHQQKCGRLIGSRHWQVSADYRPSLWRTAQVSNSLNPGLAFAKSQDSSTRHSEERVTDGFEGFAKRITALRRRISQLKVEIDRIVRAHGRYLQELAAVELEQQMERLRNYVTQARFGIAQVYERSSSRAGGAQ